jgi:Terminase large subunit, T4likevirus-type, N-terminal
VMDLRLLEWQLDPSAMFKAATGLGADDWQCRALQSTAKRQLWLIGRQLGKSVCAAIRGLHCATFQPRSEVLIVSPGERQSLLLFDKLSDFYDRIQPIRAIKRLRTELWLENGSKVIALPGDPSTTRGYTPALILLDEASRIDNKILASVTPMLAESDGDLICLSTPAGRRGFFYESWSDESQPWERISAKRVDYPHRVRPGFLESELKTLGPALFSQEHENAFIEDGDQLISDASIAAMSRYDRPNVAIMTALEGW